MCRSIRWYGFAIAFLVIGYNSVIAQPPAARRSRRRPPDQLKVGDTAPDFTLKSSDGKKKVTLSDLRGDKPVALVFGSYT